MEILTFELFIEKYAKIACGLGFTLTYWTHVDRHGPTKSLQPCGKESPKPEAGLDLQSSWLLIMSGTQLHDILIANDITTCMIYICREATKVSCDQLSLG